MKDIQFIYFDLGRVLLDFTHERGYRQIAEASQVPVERVRKLLADEGLGDRYELGKVSTAEFHRLYCKATQSSVNEQLLCHAWGDIFDLMPQSVRLASNLRAAGYRLGILSNTCEAHWEHAKRRFTVLSQLFDPVITSYEVKSMKPDTTIYMVAAERAGTPPENIFFTDDRSENVAGAHALGWTTTQFSNALQLANELERLGVRFNR